MIVPDLYGRAMEEAAESVTINNKDYFTVDTELGENSKELET